MAQPTIHGLKEGQTVRRKVAVLLGGVSAEREVSLRSGRAVADALGQKGHEVIEVDLVEEDIAPVSTARVVCHGVAIRWTDY